jgi:hypothetical protein
MFEVEWSVRFGDAIDYLREAARAGHSVELLRGLENVSRSFVADPTRGYGPNQALKHFEGIYRWRVGRGRVFYIASFEQRRAIVLHFGQRLPDNARDAYAELELLLRSDEFDRLFAKLGLAKPVIEP